MSLLINHPPDSIPGTRDKVTYLIGSSYPYIMAHNNKNDIFWITCAGHTSTPDSAQQPLSSLVLFGWAVWGVVLFTRWWLLVDHCVLRNWHRILVRAVKGLISRAGMVSICPLLWQRDVKLQQTKLWITTTSDQEWSLKVSKGFARNIPF